MPERPDTYYHNSAYDKFKGKCIAEGGTLHWADDERVTNIRAACMVIWRQLLCS